MEIKSRSEMPIEFLWKITDLYESDEKWQKDFEMLISMFEEFKKYDLKIRYEQLIEVLRLRDKVNYLTEKIYVYANLKSHEDTGNTFYQGLSAKADNAITLYSSAVAFIEPAIMELDEEKVIEICKDTEYVHYLRNIFRNKEHILSADKEKILALAYEVQQSPENIFSMLNNADLVFDDVKDKDGNLIKLTHGKYSSCLESDDRILRENAFKSYYSAYYKLKNTISSAYSGSIKADIFTSKVRNYNSALSAQLFPDNISTDVYKNLIKAVEKHLPLLHKYVEIRKKALGLSQLHFYDIYTPIVKECDLKIPYEEAKKTVIKALEPLGKEYVKILADGLENGWVDVYENIGKRSGAYSWGAYGTHPFVSLNYDNTLNNMFTLAHEMGHAMHSHYTWANQPFVYGDYTIFVAEVASTVNEALLMQYLLKTTEDKNKKKYLINYFMEQFRGTLFRQTMFAEFELIAHEMAENGEPLTFDSLCEVYSKLNHKYYGEDIVYDEEIAWEWMRIPHFYTAYYVYQYATGYSAAISISQRILNENGAEDYIKFLKGGSSNFSIELLKIAGVDMGSTIPIENALKTFESLLKEMEELIN